ncbi:MAG: hypothetical protein GY797_31610 [Deltaproteobacteria bacterium]|nr:hypothetical protein [Deltaproteobacteria bacterium]
MDYGHIIKRAVQITWQYKFLWIFGIIMAFCGQGNGGKPQFRMNYRMPYDPTAGPPDFPTYFPEPLGQTPISIYIVAGILLITVFGIIGIVVGAIGRSALIKSVDRVEDGESINFSGSWRDGVEKVVPLGLLQALLYIPLLIVWAIVAVIVFTQFWPFFSQIIGYKPNPESQEPPPFVNDIFAIFPAFFATICGVVCFFFIIQIIIALFLTFGSRAIVLENQGVISSFSRSWCLFRKNMGSTIILTILIFVISMVVGFIVAIPAMIIMFPIMMSTMPDMISGTGPTIGSYLLMGGAGIIIVIIFSLVNGVVQVFIESLWTLAYREFANKIV